MNQVVPPGCTPMTQAEVTSDMTTWAVQLLHDTTAYPMFSIATKTFGSTNVLAHVEWHPPDANNATTHRGITLYNVPQVSSAEGIDISGYQPTVNWSEVVAGGKLFAFIKATEGTTLVDAQFVNHWSGAKAVGMLRGAYHFFHPELDAVAQAQHFLAQLTDAGELPPVVDVEVTDSTPLAQIAAGVSSFVNYVHKAVGRCIIYTDPGFWNLLPTIPNIALQADLWIAQWGVPSPTSANGWNLYSFWQYTDKATVAGIPGAADMDDDRFNGSYFGLLSYAANVAVPAPPPPPAYDFTTVKGVQQALIQLGYNLGPSGADGDPGKLTRTATMQFQLAKGVDFFDTLGPQTIAALKAALGS